jgi:hypothetical protein
MRLWNINHIKYRLFEKYGASTYCVARSKEST